ncbi:MAG TPA: DoxX family protein [Gemmatimonadales bacterium]|nr:DoxX family protein [Gemmatimonadales bacterium]
MRLNNPSLGLFLLRVVVGFILLMHGLGKLVGPPFPGPGMQGFIGYLGSIHYPLPTLLGYVGMLIETLGGLAFLFGVGLTPVGLLTAVYFFIALVTVHLANGFDVFHYGDPMKRGYEYTLLLLIACLSLAFTGPGILALQIRPKQP